MDTGAAGGNCLDKSIFNAIPVSKYRIISFEPSICVGINKCPVRVLGRILLDFTFTNPMNGTPQLFREEFHIIENLIHPVVIGLPFLQKFKAILSLDRDLLYMGDIVVPMAQAPTTPPLQPPHLATFQSYTIPPLCRSYINVYLTGNQGLFDAEKTEALYVRPFFSECSKDVPQVAAHSVVDPRKKVMVVEVINAWPNPININVDTPIALVDTVNPEMRTIDVPLPTKEWEGLQGEKGEVNEEAGLGGMVGKDYEESTCPAANFSPPSAAPLTVPHTDDVPPDDVPPLVPKKPPDVEVEDIEEFPDDEARPTSPLDPDDEETILKSVVKDPPPPEPDELKGEAKTLQINKEGCIFSEENSRKFDELCDRYSMIFSKTEGDLGKTTLLYHAIELNHQNPVYTPNYKAPPPEILKAINQESEIRLANGTLRESVSPYSAPIILVKKKNGGWRYCTDFRRLNKITVKQNFPLPNIHDGLRRLKSPKVFSCLDLTMGFHQISVLESQRRYFAFSDGARHLEYQRVPMGAKNSSCSMQCLMELVMRGLPVEYLLTYLDDILIATPDEETHLVMLEKVFDALARAGLKVNPAKCVFANSSCSALGFFLDETGVRPDARNLGKIREWPQPKDITGVRGFLGLCNYYRCHIRNFAKIAEPLTNLMKKDADFEWTDECEISFQTLKSNLLEGTATSFPNFDREFFVKPDASHTTVGAVLTQLDDNGKEVLVAAASQKLNEAECKWATYDKEMFGLIWSVRHFSHYLKFRPFTIYTDHKPLLNCINIDPKKDGSGKRTRWALELSSYDFVIKHKSGKRHLDADSLSRAVHADAPSQDPRDDDDLVVLGATSQTEVPIAEINANNELSQRLRDAQKADVDISQTVEALNDPDSMWTKLKEKGVHRFFRRKRRNLVVRDGLLYSNYRSPTESFSQLVIPTSMIDDILNRAHGDYRSGHPGAKRMQDRLLRFCIWPTMQKDVAAKVASCHECQAYRPFSTKEVPVIPQHAAYPMHYIMTDLLKLYPPSEGNDHVLVVEDRYTRYCAFFAMRGAEAATMAKRLEMFITTFGFPTVWGSDNGPEFRNRLVEALCSVYNSKKEFSLSYHPQKQGQVERKNRSLISELAKKCHAHGNKWSRHLAWIEFSFNSVPHKATGRSAYSLMFGRDPRVPTQTMLPTPQVDVRGWKQNMKDYWRDTQEKMFHMQQLRDERMVQYQKSFNPESAKRMEPYKHGEWVLKRLPRENRHKLSLHWDGPLQVKKRLTQKDGEKERGNVYVLTDQEGNEHVRSMVDIKPYSFPKSQPPSPVPTLSGDGGDDGDVPSQEIPIPKVSVQAQDDDNGDIMDPILFENLFGDDDNEHFAAVAFEIHGYASGDTSGDASVVASNNASYEASGSDPGDDSGDDPGDDSDGEAPGDAPREDPEGSLGSEGNNSSGGDESDTNTFINEGLPTVIKRRMHTSTPADRQRHNFSWSSSDIDEPAIVTNESDIDARTLAALPRINLVNRGEARDISRLFDSDAETEAARLSDPTSSADPDAALGADSDQDQHEERDIHNFSTTARKGSSSNASPMKYQGGRDRSPVHKDTPRPSDDDTDGDAELDDSDEQGDAAATSEAAIPEATSRELRRLADHNNPGITEARTYGPRARRSIRYEKQE